MKTPLTHSRPSVRLLAVAAILFSLAVAAQAADRTWSGSGATPNWSDAGNWDAIPVGGDDVIFSGSSQVINSNDISGLTLGWLWLNNSGYNISGNPITLTGGLTNSFDGNVVGLNLTLGAPQTFSSQSGTLTLGPGVGLATTITNNGNALTLADGGDFLLQGAISGTGSLTMAGSGNLTVTNRQPLTGGIIVNSGTMTVTTLGNLNFGGALTPSLITINAGGTVLGNATHAIGGGTSIFVNQGVWMLNFEDYKQNLTMIDGTIEPGPSPNASGGQLRVGASGGTGSWTWFVSNSVAGSIISSPLSTVGAGVNLTLDITRGVAASDLTISGVILGAGNITFAHNGITTLSGANTQTGTLTINSGNKVVLQNQLWSSVITVASNAVFDISGASLSLNTNQTLAGVGTIIGTLYDYNPVTGSVLAPGGNNAAGTLTMDGLSLNGYVSLNFDLANTVGVGGGTNDLLVVTNFSANAGITNAVNISFLNGTPQIGGVYTLIKYGNGFSGDASQFLTSAASRYIYTFTNDTTASAIKVIITGAPGNLVWKGDGVTNTWDVASTTNWFNGAPNKDVFLQGDNATFNDFGSNNVPVTIAAAVQPTVLTVNATKDYVFSGNGKITGGGKLIKSNSGNVTILTGNDFTGGGNLSGSGTVTVGNGTATAANIGTGPLTNNTKVVFYESANTTYAGNMSGSGSLLSFMPGATLTLTGTNTFTGGLVAVSGTTQIGNNTKAIVTGNITNWSTLNLYRSDAFTNQNNITSAGNTLEYGNGDILMRGVGGMTVDGSASINTLPLGGLQVGVSAYGKLTVNPGAVITLGSGLFIGNQAVAASSSDYIQNGGTVTANGNSSRIGHWGSEVSTFTMNGGTFNSPNNQLGVGWDGIGLMYMNGGTVNVRTLNVDDNGATTAIGGTNSTLLMNNGTINIGTGGIGGNTATAFIILGGGTIGTIVPSTLIAAGWSSAMNMIMTNSGPTFDSSNSIITLTGILSGKGGLTKQGVGSLNLNGVNTYTNTTTVAAGTLQGSGTIVSPIIVNSGANISAGAGLATGTLTTSNLTVNASGNVVVDASSTTTTSDLLYVKGALALDAATPLTMNFLGGGTPFTGGAYTVVSNLVARTGHLVYSNPTRYAATVDESNPSRIQISFSGTNASLVWNGNVSTNWNVTENNWLNNGVADKYYQSDAVIFDNTGILNSNVNLAAAMTPASINVVSTGNYTIVGSPIAGVTTLTKSGSGKLTLLNSNAYTGITTIAAGTLQVGNGGTVGALPVGGTVSDFSSLVFNRSDLATFNGIVNGPGSVTAAGSGTLMILNTQNHFGGTTINPGSTVQLGNGALADSGSLGSSTATNNGTVNFYRLSSVAVATPYTGGGNFNFLGTGGNAQSAYSLNAINTFTGPVTLSFARIQSGLGAQSFGSPSSITVNPGSQVYAVATPASSIYNIPLTLYGTGWQDGLGALRIENGGTWAGNITLANNTRIGVNNATTNTITGTIGGSYELETYGGNAAAALVLTPSSANTYNALRVSIGTAGSKTIAGNNNAIPNNIPLTMNGGTLWLNGSSKTFSPFLNLNASSSLQNGSTTSPATVTLIPVLGTSTYSGTFADGATQPLNVTLNQAPGLWALNLTGSSPNWAGNLTNNGGAIVIASGTSFMGNNNVVRNLVNNNGGSFTWNINNVFGNGTANTAFPTIVLNPGCAISNNNYNIIGPVVLNGATLTGTRPANSYQQYQFRGTVTVGGGAPSVITNLSGTSGTGDHLDTATTFNVADATGNANSDLIVAVPLLNRSADYGGSGGLVKAGAGTMELDGANTYTGPTTISQGTLALGTSASLGATPITVASGATLDVGALPSGLTLISGQTLSGSGTVNGSITDASGSVIQPGGNGTAGTLTIATNLSLGGDGVLNVDLSNDTGSGNDRIIVGGALTVSGGNPTPVNFNFLNGAPVTGVAYTLIQCNGGITGTASTAFTNSSRYNPVFSQTANAVQVTFSGSASNLVWQGDGGGNAWDVATSANWFDGSAANMFFQNDTVKFDNTSANTTVNLDVAVTPASITVDSTNDYTITGSGAIAGITGITKNNTNTLTLSTANTFTGPVQINAGIVVEGNNNALPQNANVTVADGAQFDFAGQGNSSTRNYSFSIAGSGPDGSGALKNSSGAALNQNVSVASVTLTANATIGDNGRWDVGTGQAGTVLNGNGFNLTVNNVNGMSMRPQVITNLTSLTLTNGLMYYENFSQTNPWTANTTNYILSGASLGIFGGQAVSMPIVLTNATILNQGSGTPQWSGPITLQGSDLFNNSGAQNFYGVISGPGAIWVNGGTAALTLSNANTYAGGTVISNAPVTTTAVNATPGTAAVIAANPSAFGSGSVTINGLSFGSLTTNPAFFATNVLRAVEFNFAAPGTVANGISLPSSTITNVGLQLHDSGQIVNLTGQISGGFTGMTNWVDVADGAGGGVVRYGNTANNFVGAVTVLRGVLAVTGDGSLGNAGNPLRLTTGGNGGLRFDAAGINVLHAMSITAATTFNVFGDDNGDGVPETANSAIISGIISGGSAFTVTGGTNISGTSSGSLTFGGNNGYTSSATVLPATKLIAANLGALGGSGATCIVNTGGTLSLNAGVTYNSRALTLSGSGVTVGGAGVGALENLSGNNVYGGGITLAAPASIGITAGSLTQTAPISGAFQLTVTGPGSLVLSAINTYSGGTLVTGGTLVLNGVLPAGNAVAVSSGGTLGGSGIINGPVTMQAGSVLQPGAGGSTTGLLTVNNALNLGGNTVMYLNKVTPTNSQIAGVSTLVYGGSLSVGNLGGTLASGDSFKLFSAASYSGSFAATNLPALSGLAWNWNPASGTLSVVASGIATNPTNITATVSSGNLNLSWPADHTGWRLLVQTNSLLAGVSSNTNDWGTVAGSTATNQVSIPIDITKPTEFYRMVYP